MTSSVARGDRIQPSNRTLKLAEAALQRSGLKPPADQRDVVVAHLARVIANTPPASDHGQLLMRALQPGKGGQRPADERIVRRLLHGGDRAVPYAHVVERIVAAEHRRAERSAWRDRVVAKVVAEDGPRAAAVVAQHWQKTGTGPTWRQLGEAMGWPSDPKIRTVPGIIRGLERAGWLRAGKESNSLATGPRAQSPDGQAVGDRA